MDITACMIQKYRDEDLYRWMVNSAISAYPKPFEKHIDDRNTFAQHTIDRGEVVFLFSVKDARTGNELYCDAVQKGEWTHHVSFIAAQNYAIQYRQVTRMPSVFCCWTAA